jgi:hypothetical protein
MKKLIAVVLALVLAFSCTAIAFADTLPTIIDEKGNVIYYCNNTSDGQHNQVVYFDSLDKYTAHVMQYHKSETTTSSGSGTASYFECPGCGKRYTNLDDYNACLASHNYGVDSHYWTYIGQTIPQLVDTLRNYFVGSQTQALIFDILYKLLDRVSAFIDAYLGGGSTVAEQEGVNGAVAELDGALAGIDLSLPEFKGVTDIVNAIKQKIKDLYAGNIETTIVEETEAEAPAETGSANMGLAVFAAISVAAAAAFVCTKKKAE